MNTYLKFNQVKELRVTFFFALLVLCSCGNSRSQAASKPTHDESKTTASESYLAFDGNFHEQLIKPEAEAWRKIAALIYPRVCDDSETQWAAEYADSIALGVINRPDQKPAEQLAALYEIQNAIAYGMSYFVAITGLYTNPDVAKEAQTMMQRSYANLDELKSQNFNDPITLIKYEETAYHNFTLFFILATRYQEEDPMFVTDNIQMNNWNANLIKNLFEKCQNEVQAYRYSKLVNNTTFFMTYCRLSYYLAGVEFQSKYGPSVHNAALWFDQEIKKVKDANSVNMLNTLPEISVQEFTELERQASQYRIEVINLLREALNTLPTD